MQFVTVFYFYKMITLEQIEKAFQIFYQLNPKLSANIQLYDTTYSKRTGQIVKLEKYKKITAIWLDFDDLNEWKLKILFKRHKEIDQLFFINQVDNFYRVGWKVRK